MGVPSPADPFPDADEEHVHADYSKFTKHDFVELLKGLSKEDNFKKIDSILKDAPDDANALLLRSGLRFAEGKFDDAIGDLRLVLRKEPDNDRALLLLAQAYVRKNDLALAKVV